MTKLKEKDKRDKHIYQLGDIVKLHPSVVTVTNVKKYGIVTKILNEFYESETTARLIEVMFRDHIQDLYTSSKIYALTLTTNPYHKSPDSTNIRSNKLTYIKNMYDWLKPPTPKDIGNLRFINIIDEI